MLVLINATVIVNVHQLHHKGGSLPRSVVLQYKGHTINLTLFQLNIKFHHSNLVNLEGPAQARDRYRTVPACGWKTHGNAIKICL